MAINADSDLTEHAAGIAQPLDTPFPYTDVQPSSSAPISSKERSLAFLLHSTRTTSVQELEIRSRTLQENAYAIWPYPCIRRWSFLTCKSAEHPIYQDLLKLRDDAHAIFLELGCFFGTDSRRLAYDGWDPKRIIGTDLRSEWFENGYELYSDRETSHLTFIAGDIFNSALLSPPSSDYISRSTSTDPADVQLGSLTSLDPLKSKVRAMSAFSFFHLFEEKGQNELARRLATLLSAKRGSIMYGSHQAGVVKADLPRLNRDGRATRFVHSPESWVAMWEEEIFPASRSGDDRGEVRVKATASLAPSESRDSSSSYTMTWSVVVV